MGLRHWFAGGALIGCLTLVVLATKGAWRAAAPFNYGRFPEPPGHDVGAALGWALVVAGLALTGWLAWAGTHTPAGLPGGERTRASDVWGALAVAAVFTLSGMLLGFAAFGYGLRPLLSGLLEVTHLPLAAPFAQVFGSLAWGVFLVDLAWRLHVLPTERGVTGDRVAAALAGALLVIVGVCGVRPPYFMH